MNSKFLSKTLQLEIKMTLVSKKYVNFQCIINIFSYTAVIVNLQNLEDYTFKT